MTEQDVLAQELRRAQQATAMQGANQRANQFNTLAAVAQMANNPGAATAARLAQSMAQTQHKPISLGQAGFALPSSGEFVASPMYEDEKKAARQARQDVLNAQLEAREEALKATLEQRREAERARQERAEADRELRRTLGEGNLDVRRQGQVLQKTLAEIKAGDKADKDVEKKDKDLDTKVNKFSTLLDKTGVPDFESAIGIVEGALSRYKPDELPGFGRFASLVPNAMSSSEVQIVRSDMQGAANILLKLRSGAAVTEPEQRRFLTEVAAGKGMTEEALRNGWANVRKTFDAKKNNLISGVDDDVLEEYNSRSPMQFNRASKKPAGTPKPDAAAVGGPPPGVSKEVWNAMTPQEKAKFK